MKLKGLSMITLMVLAIALPLSAGQEPQTCGGSVSLKLESVKLSKFNSMTQLYADNRARGIPNYITLDYVLTYYNLLEQEMLKDIERNVLIPKFDDFINRLYKAEYNRYLKADSLTKGWLRPLIAYLSVIKKLRDPNFSPIPDVAAVVDSELALINAHRGIEFSHVLWIREDYSQYVPRGYYAEDEELSRYFLASLYASRMKFYFKESEATGISVVIARYHAYMALEIAATINSDKQLRETYEKLDTLWTMLAGPPDDLTPLDLIPFIGTDIDSARIAIWDWARQSEKRPTIISEYVDRRRLEPGLEPADVVIGMRLLGQRKLPDAVLFQALVYDRVTEYKGRGNPFTLAIINQKKVRGFPRGFDLLAALGNWKAKELLRNGNDDKYEGYKEQFGKARAELATDLVVYNSWYANDLMIVGLAAQNCPAERGVNTGLGFWVQTRHNYVLYGKQSYTVGEKSIPRLGDGRKTAYLDPAAEVYQFIARRIRNMMAYVSDTAHAKRFAAVLDTFAIISINEKLGMPLTENQVRLLNNIDLEFKRMFGEDAPVVVDVHTEPENQLVLEEAVGRPFEAKIKLGNTELRGALYSVYEFKQRMSERLDDATWRRQMQKYKPLIRF